MVINMYVYLFIHSVDVLYDLIAPLSRQLIVENLKSQSQVKLDPVGSTVRYEMMKLCTGSV